MVRSLCRAIAKGTSRIPQLVQKSGARSHQPNLTRVPLFGCRDLICKLSTKAGLLLRDAATVQSSAMRPPSRVHPQSSNQSQHNISLISLAAMACLCKHLLPDQRTGLKTPQIWHHLVPAVQCLLRTRQVLHSHSSCLG